MTDNPATKSMSQGDDDTSLPPAGFQDPNLGRRIGRFHIKSVIASGGMGTVYLAMQEEPRRHVALKLMKHGIASRSALRRFKFEAQLLGRLRHPGIAQIYESGTHDDGSGGVPYFAIEYVPAALPLTTYAKENNLDIGARLDLFTEVCDAVAHGHQKGIIHRDLKPANILVDSQGRAKIIDFGVARATDSDLAVTTLQTDLHQIIGTLQYMSPEQCGNDALDIDTSSDVYALGVVLYELLCDQLPYDISSSLLPAAVETIRNQEPARPSTINRSLKGDLETIVLKALNKGRDRRYRTAADFGDDIRRYLNDEAIVARPPSLGYQVRLFSRRYRAAYRAVVAVVAVLVVTTTVSTIFGIQAYIARHQAVEATNRARDAEDKARKALAVAETLRDVARERAGEIAIVADRAVRQSYIANIVAAQASIQAGEIQTARVRLDHATPELRGWEWYYLNAQLDQSLTVLREQKLVGHTAGVRSVTFSPDGTRIATASEDGTVRLWDATTGRPLTAFSGHEAMVTSVAFSPDGSRIVSGSLDKTMRLWDALAGRLLAVHRGHEGGVISVAFSPDGSRIASGSGDGTVRVWDAASGKMIAIFRGPHGSVLSVAFSPDGSLIASGSDDKMVRLWDTRTGGGLAVLHGHEGGVISVAFSPDGSRIASASRDGTVRLWGAAGVSQIKSRIVSASGDWTWRRIDDVSPPEIIAVLRAYEGEVVSVAFSPDGSRIASASKDKTVRLWIAPSGQESAAPNGHESQELIVLRGHENEVWSVAFSPNGEWIASASQDGTVRLWDTVAHHDRVAQRDQAIRDMKTIEPVVEGLFSDGSTCSDVATRLRSDASLSEPLRRAALNLVLMRCSKLPTEQDAVAADPPAEGKQDVGPSSD